MYQAWSWRKSCQAGRGRGQERELCPEPGGRRVASKEPGRGSHAGSGAEGLFLTPSWWRLLLYEMGPLEGFKLGSDS